MAASTVPIQLIHGDARACEGDALVMGWKNPLRDWLTTRAGRDFEPLPVQHREIWGEPLRVKAEVLKSMKLPWRTVATLKCRLTRPFGTRLSDDLSDVIAELYRNSGVRRFVLVPPSWRQPETVAFNMVLAMWLVAYMPEVTVLKRRFEGRFTIACDDGVDVFADLLENGSSKFHEKFRAYEKILSEKFWYYEKSKLSRVKFNVSYGQVDNGATSNGTS